VHVHRLDPSAIGKRRPLTLRLIPTRQAMGLAEPRKRPVEETMKRIDMLGRLLQKAGPYLLLELLLPGGTMFALLLFLYRRGRLPVLDDARRAVSAVTRAVGSEIDQVTFAVQPCFVFTGT
jgi:hypothetical protein